MLAALLLTLALQRETIAAVQIHGNTATSDADIRALAAIQVGDPFEPGTIEQVAERLRGARRFKSVQVLKRVASIADPTQILVVIFVDEGPVKIEMTGNPDEPTRIVRARRLNLMFLPVLYAEDGYGVTYGARMAWTKPAGKQSRLVFPLTWGGDKRAGVEIDKTLDGGPLDRVTAGAALTRRRNPFYDENDDRRRLWIRGERNVAKRLRLGTTFGWQRVTFPLAPGGPREASTLGHAGADAVFDTRVDPMLPRNAVYGRAAWEHIGSANRLDLDGRGYVGLFGQTVLALRATRSDADRPLPLYLKPLLGGMANLRGFRAGEDAGDSLMATSAEVIVPLTTPLSVGRIGVSAFTDAGVVYDKGQRLADQPWKQGFGGSVWFSAAFVRVNVAVAHGRGSSTRVHVGANVTF